MSLRIAFRAATAAVLVAAAIPSAATAGPVFSNLFVFGDSLVDAGNIRVVTNGAAPNPALGYFDGRFTNGPNYVDYISSAYFGQLNRPSLTGGTNFAYGGARIVSDTTDFIPDITPQLNQYKAASGNTADPNALYILNAGGNDVFAIGRFLQGQTNQLNPIGNVAGYMTAAVDTYANAVLTLNQLGARNILITGIPNSTTQIGLDLDAALQAKLDTLTLAPETNLFRFSYIDFFNRVAADPASLGLPPLDLQTSCIQAQAQATGCVGYFSFDGVHPTAAVQAAVYRDMVRQFGFGGVPEPASWAMMISGFGLVGAAMRRRPRVMPRVTVAFG